MFKTSLPQPSFSVLEAFIGGLRHCAAHARLFAVLSFIPYIVTLATLFVLRLLADSLTMFWLPLVQFPTSFVTGLQCALIVRFLVLKEYPILEDSELRAARNRSVMQAAVIYATVSYFATGAYAGLMQARAYIVANPETSAPFAPFMAFGLAFILWSARYLWLHVPRALDWQWAGLSERIGRWGGSFRVFALYAFCALTLNFVVSFLRLGVDAAGDVNAGGFAAAFDDAVVALGTMALAVLFSASTAVAMVSMTSTGRKP